MSQLVLCLALILGALSFEVAANVPRDPLERTLYLTSIGASDEGPQANSDFCRNLDGTWEGICELREGAKVRRFTDVISALARNNCTSFSVGFDWIDPSRTEVTSVVSPTVSSDRPSEILNTRHLWRWRSDHNSLEFEETRFSRVPVTAPEIGSGTVRGIVSINEGQLVRQFAFEDLSRSLTCAYQKSSGSPSLASQGSLASFLDQSDLAPSPVSDCTDFSGNWKGHCIYIDSSTHREWDEETLMEQSGCAAFKRDGVWTRVGAVKNRLSTYPSGTGVILFTDLSFWQWSGDRKRLENSGVELGGRVTTGAIEQMKSQGSLAIEDGKLIHHRLAHETCLFHCVYQREP